jgi:lysophospholipase L1-like esterase
MLTLRPLFITLLLTVGALTPTFAADAPKLDPQRHLCILFLGDSITYAGQYIVQVEFALRTRYPNASFEIIGLGLPSETLSGLSEPEHLKHGFPRPDLHERLARTLKATDSHLVFACYGINDGIYLPFSEERFAAYQNGYRKLVEEVKATGADLIILTPPPFDPFPIKSKTTADGVGGPFLGYDEVLTRYSAWLLEQRQQGWNVIDLHGPMNEHVAARRKENPTFTLAGDGVHPNSAGHELMAQLILRALNLPPDPNPARDSRPAIKLIEQRNRLLTDSLLTTISHKRPGMSKGLPLPDAKSKAAEINEQIRKMIAPAPK